MLIRELGSRVGQILVRRFGLIFQLVNQRLDVNPCNLLKYFSAALIVEVCRQEKFLDKILQRHGLCLQRNNKLRHLVLQFILHECIELGQLTKELIEYVQNEQHVVNERYICNNILASVVDQINSTSY